MSPMDIIKDYDPYYVLTFLLKVKKVKGFFKD